MASLTIAIDGPAGAGKSTIAKLLAERLGLTVLDTGAMYRCVALLALEQGIQEDFLLVIELAREIEIEFKEEKVLANGKDVTTQIRSVEVGQWASKLSTIGEVRAYLVQRQQQMASKGGFVLEGRDVTSVVAPQADLKIFLTASIEERARRRWLETKTETLQDVVLHVVERDHRDYTRTESPLKLVEDAHIVESFGRTPDQVIDLIVGLLPTLKG